LVVFLLMINCKLVLPVDFCLVSPVFCQISLKSFSELVSKLRMRLSYLKKIQSQQLLEIKIELSFEQEQDIVSIDRVNLDSLINFVRSQDGILLRFKIRSDNNQILINLQQTLDLTVLSNLKDYFKRPEPVQTFVLASLFEQQLPEISLTKVIPFKEIALPPLDIKSSSLVLMDLDSIQLSDSSGILANYTNRHHPGFERFQYILKLISPEMIAKIVSSIGSKGLERLCASLSIFDTEDWPQLYQLFFKGENEKDLFLFAFPSGVEYLQAINAWPKNLVKYWIHWLSHGDAPISFADAVRGMDKFWQVIQAEYPAIPKLEKRTEIYPFNARLEEMIALLEAISPAYKKLHIEALFKLYRQSISFYRTIFSGTNCLWICQEMFDSECELNRYDIHAYEGITRKSYYFQYVSQHIKDSLSPASLIFEYADVIDASPIRTQSISWQLATWCASSLKLMTKDDFVKFYHFIISATFVEQEEILKILFNLSVHQRPNLKTIHTMLELVKKDIVLFRQLLQFYYQWQLSAPKTYVESWATVFEYLGESSNPSIFPEIFNQAKDLNLKKYSFEQTYLKTLLLLFVENSSQCLDGINVLVHEFEQFPDSLKMSLLAILSSYGTRHIGLKLEQLHKVFQALKLDTPSLEDVFRTQLPDSSFKYFKNAIDYQLVFSKMGQLIKTVQAGLDFFLGDIKIFFFIPPIRKMLKDEMIAELTEQKRHLSEIQAQLEKMRGSTQQVDVEGLFAQLKIFDAFFVSFVERELGQTFKPILISFLPGLDKELRPDGTIKNLMQSVLNQYHLIQNTNLSQYLTPELLQVLVDSSSAPLMQRLLKYFLVDELVHELEGEILTKMQDSQVPIQERKKLALFLDVLPLDATELKNFFVRYQGISLIIKQWQGIENELLNLNLHPELPILIWKVCVDAQFINEGIYSSLHWNIVIHLLKHCISLLQNHPELNFSLVKYIEAFFKATSSLQTFVLHVNGELFHPHLDSMFRFMDDAILNDGSNPLFYNLVPQAIESILASGEVFDFKKNMQFFNKLGGDTKLLNHLMQLASQNSDFTEVLPSILEKVSKAAELEKKTHRPWTACFIKILNLPDLKTYLKEVSPLYDWLFAHEDFDWLEIIVDDKSCTMQALTQLIQLMQEDSIWSKSYYAVYKNPLVLPGVCEETTVVPEAPTELLPPSGFWSRLTSGIRNFLSFQRPAEELELEEDDVGAMSQEDSQSASNQLLWDILKKPPYPSIDLLNKWLSNPSDTNIDDLMEFDSYPLGPTSEYLYTELDVKGWMQDLLFYDYLPPAKEKIEARLRSILASSNGFFKESRSELLERFQELKQSIQTQEFDENLQNYLLAVVTALYYKATSRKPYPVQLLMLLVNIEYQNKNVVFEIDTGEGKAITAAILAVLKLVFNKDSTVEVRTANRDLVWQDFYTKGHWRFFKLLGIPHAIVYENSALETYCKGGINYTTEQDIVVFKEVHRLQNRGIASTQYLDIIQDEVDHAILEQTSVVNLVRSSENATDLAWLYQSINQFTDLHFTEPAQYSLLEWGVLLKKFVVEKHDDSQYRLSQIHLYPVEKWQDWIELGVYAKFLKENQHFIVETLEHNGSRSYQVVPYINSEIKYGFDISYKMKLGLKQLLHARLNSELRLFKVEAEGIVLSQLAPSNLKQVHSFVGLSGSIGALSECRELRETLCAAPVRIPRNLKSKLKELSPVLAQNRSGLYKALDLAIHSESNPILLCIEDINAAHELYKHIESKFPLRPKRLLTGQESQLERSRWLYAQTDSAYAGSPYSITVATQICGRGTDIIVQAPYYLTIMQVGILAPRNAMQIKGRTARNNNHGSYQLFMRSDELLKTSSLQSIDRHNLSLAIESMQKQLIFAMRQKRLMLRMKGWFRQYLFENLDNALMNATVDLSQRNYYYLQLLKLLESIGNVDILNPELYFENVKIGFDKVLAQIYISGHIQEISSVEELIDHLIADKPNWLSIASKELFSKAHDAGDQITNNLFSDFDFLALSNIIEKHLSRNQSKNFVLQFLQNKWFSKDSITIKSINFLHSSAVQFQKNQNEENWLALYHALKSMMELYTNQELGSRFWHLSYWKSFLSPLYDWVMLSKSLDFELYQRKILDGAHPAFYMAMYNQLKDKFIKSPTSYIGILVQKIFNRILMFFNVDLNNRLKDISILFDAFNSNPSKETFKVFFKNLFELENSYLNMRNSLIRRFIFWLFGSKEVNVWLEIGKEIPNLIKESKLFDSNLKQWITAHTQVAHFQLLYREQLIQTEKQSKAIPSFLFRHIPSFFLGNYLNSSMVIDLSKYEKEILQENVSMPMQMSFELDELVRAFPDEIKQLYLGMYKISFEHDDAPDKSIRWMLLAILSNYFSPFVTAKVQLDFHEERIELLLSELERWSNRRELMIEWDGMNPSLNYS